MPKDRGLLVKDLHIGYCVGTTDASVYFTGPCLLTVNSEHHAGHIMVDRGAGTNFSHRILVYNPKYVHFIQYNVVEEE